MITIQAKNAKASEGKARIDEMAELAQPKPSTRALRNHTPQFPDQA